MLSYQLQGERLFSRPHARLRKGYLMTMRDDFKDQASVLMLELNDATSAMMGMVGSHHTTGPVWAAAAERQSRSFGRLNSFLRKSEIYGQALN
jgi:hypothetical protein